MAPSSTIATLFSTSDARPELFGYHRVDWITGPADADGEAPWSTSDMIIGKGWRPTTYDEAVMRALFGAPERVAPHTRAWAFALEAAPGFCRIEVPGTLFGAWCIEGRALGCNERLSRLYDDLKCAGW